MSYVIIHMAHTRNDSFGTGQVAVLWLCLSWISTVILGAPILGAVFGDSMKGISYGILAAISSFTFQLPLQLILLEYHAFETKKNIIKSSNPDITVDDSNAVNQAEVIRNVRSQEAPEFHNSDIVEVESCHPEPPPSAQQQTVWKRVGCQMLLNPVLWGITGGFILSLSTLGPSYLKAPSVYGDWFTSLAAWLGDCVYPLSLFTMGVWISSQRIFLCNISTSTLIVCMLSKLALMPLIMVGITKAFNLNDEAGRAAVLIACLPVSMASFSLGSRYEIGEELLSVNVILGTVLLLPTVLLWSLAMDKVGLYTDYQGVQ